MDVGVPESKPVEVSKATPAGVAGEIAKLTIVPPVDAMEYPEMDELTVLVSAIDESVKAGAPTDWIVSTNVAVADPDAFVAVIV
jgi:hypothetical protein